MNCPISALSLQAGSCHTEKRNDERCSNFCISSNPTEDVPSSDDRSTSSKWQRKLPLINRVEDRDSHPMKNEMKNRNEVENGNEAENGKEVQNGMADCKNIKMDYKTDHRRMTDKFPPFIIRHHTTLFGGTRDDIIVVDIIPVEGLLRPCTLREFVKLTLPNLGIDQLNAMVECQAIYISHLQLPTDPTTPAVERSRRFRRQQARQRQRAAHRRAAHYANVNDDADESISHQSLCLTAPLLVRRNPVRHLDGCELPTSTKSVRFHLKPLRFPVAPLLEWTTRIIWQNSLFIAVDKPAGLPCEPVASNNLECLHEQVGMRMGIKVHPLHRIDLWTSGVVCLGKTSEAVTVFNAWQREKNIRKIYRLLVSRPTHNAVPLSQLLLVDGLGGSDIRHWMPSGSAFKIAAPRVVSRTPLKGWKEAICRVTKFRQILRSDVLISEHPGAELGWKVGMMDEIERLLKENHELLDVEVELVTGRTHQLRAQFAALGLPLVGDSLYQPLSGVTVEEIDQRRMDEELNFCDVVVCGGKIDTSKLTLKENQVLELMVKTAKIRYPLALQSHQMNLPGVENSIRADEPWWLGGSY